MPSENTEQRKLAAIMFTDMVGYSALSQRNEALALELLVENQRLLRTQFPLFNGREVKTTGDGFLVEFPSALQAAQCAVEIQRAVVARNSTQPGERHIQVRIGIHVGDVVHREADMYGDGVNIAARIEPLAIGGGICLSDTVYAQVRNKLDVGLTKLNSPELKHIEVPMDVYRVVLPWQQQAPVTGKSGSPSPSKPSARLVAVGLIVALALGGVGWWLFHPPGQAAKQAAHPQTNTPSSLPTAATTSATDRKSIAVLPFVNLSSDKENEYLSDGITEDLCTALTQVKELRVPARTSSFVFKGKTEDIQKIGQQLHVATVLEGSVRKAGNKLRINVQLINVADGFHLWATSYDREMSDLLALQSEITQEVVAALRVQLLPGETRQLEKKATENPEAHRVYLLGRHYSLKATAEDSQKAVEYFNQALQKDPNYARAYCGLIDTMGDFRWVPKESYPKLRAYAEAALKLDPLLAEAHVSMAQILLFADWDFPGATKELQLALKLNPNLASAHAWYALYSYLLGQFPEALSAARQALELDPLSPEMNNALVWTYYNTHDFNNAIKSAKQAMELDPSYPWNYAALGLSLVAQGKPAEAIPPLEKLVSLAPVPLTRSQLACAYAAAGDRVKAEAVLKKLDELSTRQFVPSSSLAFIRLSLGQKEPALELFERAVAERDPMCLWMKFEPGLDSLRREPRFQALLKKVGLDK